MLLIGKCCFCYVLKKKLWQFTQSQSEVYALSCLVTPRIL